MSGDNLERVTENWIISTLSHKARFEQRPVLLHESRLVYTMSLETFKAPELGYLGYIQNGRPYFYRTSTRRHTLSSEFSIAALTGLPRVDIVLGYVNDDSVHVEAAVTAGAIGIVVAAPGHGSLSSVLKAALISARQKGVAVGNTSRTGNGMITRVAEDDQYGFVAGDNLNSNTK